ncbi:hypothetical protein, partial [Pseudoruegeria sp. SK021]|uniref:hypothetical protein n=1 Tax=Pseudoruegeria sp. SK021 TaxID=1933035 RepID=UPI00197E9634
SSDYKLSNNVGQNPENLVNARGKNSQVALNKSAARSHSSPTSHQNQLSAGPDPRPQRRLVVGAVSGEGLSKQTHQRPQPLFCNSTQSIQIK